MTVEEGVVIKAGADYVGGTVLGAEWEYYVWLPPDPDMFLQNLAELGQHGWELVLQVGDKFIFKRPMLQRGEEEQDESGS